MATSYSNLDGGRAGDGDGLSRASVDVRPSIILDDGGGSFMSGCCAMLCCRGSADVKEVSEAQSLVSASKAPALSEEDTAFLLANYPKCLEDVSTEWLSVLLRAKVSAMSLKLKLEAGVTGDAAIFNLEYASGDGGGPASIVLKYAKAMAANRQLAQECMMYEKETFFYKELHDLVSPVLPIPEVFGVFVDPVKPEEFFCIAMEDLSVEFETMDQIKGISWTEARDLAADVGAFHAKFWEHDLLKNKVVNGGKPDSCNLWFESWIDMFKLDPTRTDTFIKGFTDNENLPLNGGTLNFLPTDDLKMMLRLWKAHSHALVKAFHDILDSRPRVLCHGDMRADNLFRKQGGGGFKFIDWQTFAASAPGCEMTQLLAGSIHPVDDLEHMDEILAAYMSNLHKNKATRGYTLQMLKDDFTITTTILVIGLLGGPFVEMLDQLPDGHPLWGLFDSAFPRYVKCLQMCDCAAFTIATAARLGLEPDPKLPWYTEPPTGMRARSMKALFRKSVNKVLFANRITSISSAMMVATTSRARPAAKS